MILAFICQCCGKLVPRNPRIKNQKYCSGKECQKTRMRIWKKRQYKKNIEYQKKSQSIQKVWRKKYPSYQYQRDYRKAHPDYVMRNRDQQRERNRKRQNNHSTMIVKMHALLLQPREDGVYTLSRIKKNMIVNRNALTLQPSVDGAFALFKVKRKKIVNRNALISQEK